MEKSFDNFDIVLKDMYVLNFSDNKKWAMIASPKVNMSYFYFKVKLVDKILYDGPGDLSPFPLNIIFKDGSTLKVDFIFGDITKSVKKGESLSLTDFIKTIYESQ